MDEITSQLWVTDISGVREQDTSRFDRVITVCQDEVSDNVGCEYEHFDMADGPHNTGYGGEFSYDLFANAADAVHEALEDGETVLVHCHVGQNRSISVSAAALARFSELSHLEALARIEDERPIANPTERFREHLQQYASEHCPEAQPEAVTDGESRTA